MQSSVESSGARAGGGEDAEALSHHLQRIIDGVADPFQGRQLPTLADGSGDFEQLAFFYTHARFEFDRSKSRDHIGEYRPRFYWRQLVGIADEDEPPAFFDAG